MTSYDAVVLAGGAAKRLGGVDKPGVLVGGRSLLDRVLAACGDAATTVVVAERRPTARPVLWAREDPPGGGPLAALGAGLNATTSNTVLVLSADLPFLGEQTVQLLLDALDAERVDGAVFVDRDGRDQPLVAAYRTEALRHGADRLAVEHGGLGGLPLRRLTAGLTLTRVTEPGDSRAAFDCDTWEDIAEARARIREHDHVLDEWITAVKDELGIDLEVDIGALLDLARDAAHGVARPAAPLTTFLVGYAAARASGGPEAVAEATRKAVALAARWAAEDKPAEDTASGTAPTGPAPSGTAPAGPGSSGTAPDAAPDAG